MPNNPTRKLYSETKINTKHVSLVQSFKNIIMEEKPCIHFFTSTFLKMYVLPFVLCFFLLSSSKQVMFFLATLLNWYSLSIIMSPIRGIINNNPSKFLWRKLGKFEISMQQYCHIQECCMDLQLEIYRTL